MKIITVSLLLIIVMLCGYFIFILNFELFPSNRKKLASFQINESTYAVYSFEGNATVSSNLQLLKNEMMLEVFKTTYFYSQANIIDQNDSTLTLLLNSEEANVEDTIRVKFKEMINLEY